MAEDNKERFKNNHNHYILTVVERSQNCEIYGTYFDGTQAQAIKYFNALPRVKKYLKEQKKFERYLITMRANALLFGWSC